MPRATCELDALLDHPSHPQREFDRIERDDEWCRALSAELCTSTKPETVFADLHDTLLSVRYPAAADPCEIKGRLQTARAAVRDWASRALAGHAKITLDGDDCYMLFQLIGIIDVVTPSPAATNATWRWTEDVAEPMTEIEPALVQVSV